MTRQAAPCSSGPYETSGLAVAEALPCRVPATVSGASRARDLIRDGKDGRLCQPWSSEALFASLHRMRDDAGTALIGENAYALYWAHPMSVSAHRDRSLAAYRSSGLGARDSACGSKFVRQS